MPNGTMMACPFEKGGYAVRPMDWAGVWDKEGRLESTCRVTALFTEKHDAERYCEICNDPIRYSAIELRNELLKHEVMWDAFLACIESSLKERMLPFVSEGEVAKEVLERIVGDEGLEPQTPRADMTFEGIGDFEKLREHVMRELNTVDITSCSESVTRGILAKFPEVDRLVITDPAYYDAVRYYGGFRSVPGGDAMLYGRPLVKDFEKKINTTKVSFSAERGE